MYQLYFNCEREDVALYKNRLKTIDLEEYLQYNENNRKSNITFKTIY